MSNLDVSSTVKQLLIDILSLDLEVEQMADETLLLGDIPEFDSMAIVSVITALEETFGFMAEDDELSAEVFESVASLVDFVKEKQAA
ncbi:acyl carrier protein [Aliikangiella sp. G2MR2-5]|uniref:acyl carrier protein n=1 Tax=Aliikangiella sp. G2MR2-5 TaxID=2788943 RepID=UPI0018A95B2E|nr:acyl carrier protein [Aliikangiella sp. G2MR2-5]